MSHPPLTHKEKVRMGLVKEGRRRGLRGKALKSHVKGGIRHFKRAKSQRRKATIFRGINEIGSRFIK